MRAYQLPKAGAGIEALTMVERPMPKPLHRQVLVKVIACSLNYRDLGIVRGTYRMPVRTTRDRIDGSEFAGRNYMFDENYANLQLKVMRLAATQTAWAEKPPSRTRRFVNNVRVYTRADERVDEYVVQSNLLLIRNRYDLPEFEFVSARRTDVLRRSEDSFQIAMREIFSDQATLGTQNLAIFL